MAVVGPLEMDYWTATPGATGRAYRIDLANHSGAASEIRDILVTEWRRVLCVHLP